MVCADDRRSLTETIEVKGQLLLHITSLRVAISKFRSSKYGLNKNVTVIQVTVCSDRIVRRTPPDRRRDTSCRRL